VVDIGRPTLSECRDWRDSLCGSFTTLDEGQSREEELYFQSYRVWTPKGRESVKTGSAPSDAEGAIDSLVPQQVQIRCRPARATDAWQKIVDKRVRFGRGLLHSWRNPRDQLRLIATDQVLRRVGVGRVLWDKRYWPDRPDDWKRRTKADQEAWETRHRTRCPLTFEARNPRYVRWMDSADGTLLAVVEHYPLVVADAKVTFAAYPKAQAILRKHSNVRETVWVDDLWVGDHRCLLLDDEPVFGTARGQYEGVMPSPYSEIPYVLFPYRELNFDSPGERYRGMFTNAGDLYRYESEMLGMVTEQTRWNGWRTWLGWWQGDDDIEMFPGKIIKLREHMHEYLRPLTGETFPPDLLAPIQMYDGYIGRNSVVTGGPATGEQARSAQQAWAQMAMRQLKLEPAKSADQTGLAQAFRLATVIGSIFLDDDVLTLPLPGRDEQGNERGQVSIRAADLKDYADCYEVTFGSRPDPALIELNKSLMAFSQGGYMPIRTAIEMGGLTDVAQDWLDEMRRQKLENLPGQAELAALKQYENYYGRDSEEVLALKQLMQQQHQGQGGGPPQQGGPGIPQPGTSQPPGGLARAGTQNSEALGLGPGRRTAGARRPGGRMGSRPAGMPAGGGAAGGASL
jgi:hypothetical protein